MLAPEFFHLPSVISLMDAAQSAAYAPAPEGISVLTADFQTSGRGQRGTHWESEACSNLLMALRFAPVWCDAAEQFALSEAVAVAVQEAVTQSVCDDDAVCAEDFSLKWPNDLYWRDKKLGGLLLQHRLSGRQVERTIAGLGLNVNQTVFRSDAPNPVSLSTITGHSLCLSSLKHAIVRRVCARLQAVADGDSAALHTDYCARLYRREGLHRFRDVARGADITASLHEVLPTGRLVLALTDGTLRSYYFKEVVWL